MRFLLRPITLRQCLTRALAAVLTFPTTALASAYNAHPKLVVVIIIDQFATGGFSIFLNNGANFTDCNYDYANTRTAPGHATLFTGAYSKGHGVAANEWWDHYTPHRNRDTLHPHVPCP